MVSWGLARKRYRLGNLFLVDALVTFAAWFVIKIIEMKGIHRQYPANTVKGRGGLSTFYLGLEVIASMTAQMTKDDFRQVIHALRENRYAVWFAR